MKNHFETTHNFEYEFKRDMQFQKQITIYKHTPTGLMKLFVYISNLLTGTVNDLHIDAAYKFPYKRKSTGGMRSNRSSTA